MFWDTLLSLREAWHWVQIGFCAALGASVIMTPFALIRGGNGGSGDDYPEPHCSKCCPNSFDDDHLP